MRRLTNALPALVSTVLPPTRVAKLAASESTTERASAPPSGLEADMEATLQRAAASGLSGETYEKLSGG